MYKNIKRINDFNRAVLPPESEHYTPCTVVHETDLLKLFMYRMDRSADATMIICPDAGHGGIGLVDKGPGKSLVATMLAAKKGSVFVLEWKSATQATKNATLENIISEIYVARYKASGFEKTHIMGLCAGGWKAAIFTAIFPDKVSRLSVNGAPIDFRIGNGALTQMVDKLGSEFYHNIVEFNNGVMPGKMLLFGWEMGNPWDRFFIDFQNLWNSTFPGREAEYNRNFTHRSWYKNTRDVPGPLYLQTIDDMFIGNKLIKKELYIGGNLVDLKNIKCRVDVMNGDEDKITLKEQCFALSNEVSTPEHMITRTIITGTCKKGCGYDGVNDPSCGYKGSDDPKCNYKGVGHVGGFNSEIAQPQIHNLFNSEVS